MDTSHSYDNLHLKDYLQVLGRRRSIAILFFFATVSLVTLGTILMTPVYRATATLLINMESPNVLTTSGTVNVASQDYYAYKEYFHTQREILCSRTIARQVFIEFHLKRSKKYMDADDPIGNFLKTISSEPLRDTRLLKLHVDNEDPVLASRIANRVAEIYIKRNLYFITQDELTNLLKNEYLKLEARFSEYAKRYKHKYPKMIRLKVEMDEMRKKIEQVKNSDLEYNPNIEEIQNNYQHALQGLKANNVRLQDWAEPPVSQRKPKPLINVLLSIFLGFFGSIGLVFFVEYFDDNLQGFIDLKRLVPWKILGSVPNIDAIGKRKRCLFADTKIHDPATEAYRSIRTYIEFSRSDASSLQVLTVLSTGPQEGKTTTICNLAIVLAHARKKVLLVDADLRKPRLFSVFKKNNKFGLSTYLSDECEYKDMIQKTDIKNLSLITSGPIIENSSELLLNGKIHELIKTAREEFDYVLFDASPIPVVTDGIILAKTTNGVIMVVQKGVTSRRALGHVRQLLSENKITVIGTVLNKSPLTSGGAYYSHYYKK